VLLIPCSIYFKIKFFFKALANGHKALAVCVSECVFLPFA
jgi:hypothetical protein